MKEQNKWWQKLLIFIIVILCTLKMFSQTPIFANEQETTETTDEETTEIVDNLNDVFESRASYPFVKVKDALNLEFPHTNWKKVLNNGTWLAGPSETIPAEYSFYINPTSQSKRVFKNQQPIYNENAAYQNGAKQPRYEYRLRELNKDPNNLPIIEYTKVGIYNGQDIGLRITILDWGDLTTAASVSGGKIYLPKTATESIRFDLTRGHLNLRYEFIDSQGKLINVKGYMTTIDTDGREFLQLPNYQTSSIKKVYQTIDTDLFAATSNNSFLSFAEGTTASNEATPQAFTTMIFDGNKIEFNYSATNMLDRTPFLVGDFTNGWEYTFLTSSYKTRSTEVAKPTKLVSDDNEKKVESNTLEHINEKFTYNIEHYVSAERPEWRFKQYQFEDDLPDALKVESLKIYNALTKEDVSSLFTISIVDSTSKVMATLKNPAAAAFYGQTYMFEIATSIKSNIDLTTYLDSNKDRFVFKNTGKINIQHQNKTALESYATKEVTTFAPAPGRIQIKKVDKETNKLLAGAMFEIYDSQKKLVFSGTTDKTGVLGEYFWKGTYTVKEVKAPNGYTIDASAEQVVVIPNNSRVDPPIEVTFKDTLIKPKPAITKVASVTEAKYNDTFNYTITVANNAPAPVGVWTNVVMTDDVPVGLEIDKTSLPATATATGNRVTWQVGDLKGGQKQTLTFKVTVKSKEEKNLLNKAVAVGKDWNGTSYSVNDEAQVKLYKLYLHLRQVVLQPNDKLVLPVNGYYQIMNSTKQSLSPMTYNSGLVSLSTTKHTAAEITKTLFASVGVYLEPLSPWIGIVPTIPEYYRYVGHIQSSDPLKVPAEHASNLLTTKAAAVNYETVREYWVTIFIQPTFQTGEEGPRPYSWDNRLNKFGHLSQ